LATYSEIVEAIGYDDTDEGNKIRCCESCNFICECSMFDICRKVKEIYGYSIEVEDYATCNNYEKSPRWFSNEDKE